MVVDRNSISTRRPSLSRLSCTRPLMELRGAPTSMVVLTTQLVALVRVYCTSWPSYRPVVDTPAHTLFQFSNWKAVMGKPNTEELVALTRGVWYVVGTPSDTSQPAVAATRPTTGAGKPLTGRREVLPNW